MKKKLYQIIKEEQIIAVLLSSSVEDCEKYILNNLLEDLEYVDILEVAKQETQEVDSVIPLMVAKKSSWYDLRHYRHLYIYNK